MSRRSLLSSFGLEGDAAAFATLARELEERGQPRLAATAYDRAFGLDPGNASIAAARRTLLDQLAVTEHGITFRYIPAGSFVMGFAGGEPDERPVHIVEVGDYWLAETPVSWATYCDLMGWEPAPNGVPKPEEAAAIREQTRRAREAERERRGLPARQPGKPANSYQAIDIIMYETPDPWFDLMIANMIRLQYCEDWTLHAYDWHRHVPGRGMPESGNSTPSKSFWPDPPRSDPSLPWTYNLKPLVAVSWQDAVEASRRMSDARVMYRLPTEAEWEKAARGGLIDQHFPWGSVPPSAEQCDFDRFEQFAIQQMRSFPPNAYGLYAMSGGVWEWTSDWYDALYYAESAPINPTGPVDGVERVVRGGSWSDCAEVLRVSFRASRDSRRITPNIGFRLCRVERLATT